MGEHGTGLEQLELMYEWKSMKNKKLRRFLVLFLFGCPMSCYIGVKMSETQYANFTRFSTAAEVQEYFESHLTVGRTTNAEIVTFLENIGINNCSFNETFMSFDCTVLAPRAEMNDMRRTHWLSTVITDIFTSDYYYVVVYTEDNLFDSVRVGVISSLPGGSF